MNSYNKFSLTLFAILCLTAAIGISAMYIDSYNENRLYKECVVSCKDSKVENCLVKCAPILGATVRIKK